MELNRKQIIKQMQDWCDNMCENACLKGESLNGKIHTCDICFPNTVKNALSLIKELTEENERLRNSSIDYRNIPEIKAKERADTVWKMHSEIEARCIKGGIYPAFVKSTIDQIAKEMIGEKND